jgi:hypothetical protein
VVVLLYPFGNLTKIVVYTLNFSGKLSGSPLYLVKPNCKPKRKPTLYQPPGPVITPSSTPPTTAQRGGSDMNVSQAQPPPQPPFIASATTLQSRQPPDTNVPQPLKQPHHASFPWLGATTLATTPLQSNTASKSPPTLQIGRLGDSSMRFIPYVQSWCGICEQKGFKRYELEVRLSFPVH